MKIKDRIIPIVAAAAMLLPMFFSGGCANTTQAPSGGPKDTIPPYMLWTSPKPGATNVPTHKPVFQFGFDEYIKVKNPGNVFLSPPLQRPPKTKMKGKTLIVYFEDEDLAPNTTYTLSFTDALADNNEGNMFQGYNYVFSTGETIDSMVVTGVVQNCNTLDPMKSVTVLLYKNHADSAIFLERPFAAGKTDEWGFFAIPFLQDTLYRIYALKDENNDNIYQPESESVAFIDSLIRPVMKVNDTLPELMVYDMKDTLGCQARKEEHVLKMFRENPTKQMIVNKERVSDRASYITFMADYAWIDSLWISGYPANKIITQFNVQQDSLEIWVNDRRPAPDTLHLFVNYRKTDTLGALVPEVEHIKLVSPTPGVNKNSRAYRSKLKHEDTICVFKLEAKPETVEQEGFNLEFTYPIIYENFDSVKFKYINPKQKEAYGTFRVEKDTMNLRHYRIFPDVKMQTGFEYVVKVPHRCFQDINGFWSDSTEVKVKLPSDEKLSNLALSMVGVDRKIIVDLLNDKRNKVLRTYVIDKDQILMFPYLKEGRYSIRITDDGNRNGVVDTGNLLEHRQPETVTFYMLEGHNYIDIPASAEVEQTIDVAALLSNGQ